MREIKFRARDTNPRPMMISSDAVMDFPTYYFSKGNRGVTLMQYTGLKDKNGVEIYEGDVIGTISFKWVVYFGENQDRTDQWGWSVRNIQTEKTYFIDRSILCGEIIGNIHENPELLEAP